jgi:predicted metalloprotease with PDZ domain
VQVKAVLAGGPGAAAGVSAGDELLAVDGWRIRRLDDALAWLRPGAPFDLLLVRDQRVQTRCACSRNPTDRWRHGGAAASGQPAEGSGRPPAQLAGCV